VGQLVDHLGVRGEADRLANPQVVERRLPDVHDELETGARLEAHQQLVAGLVAVVGHELRWEVLDHVRFAGRDDPTAHRVLGDEAHRDALEIRGPGALLDAGAPVVLVPTLEGDVAVRHPLDELERPGADEVVVELARRVRGERRGRPDRDSDHRVEEVDPGPVVAEAQRVGVDDLHRHDRAEFVGRLGAGRLGRLDPLEVVLQRLGVEALAILEVDVVAEVEGPGAPLVLDVPAGGQEGLDGAGLGVGESDEVRRQRVDEPGGLERIDLAVEGGGLGVAVERNDEMAAASTLREAEGGAREEREQQETNDDRSGHGTSKREDGDGWSRRAQSRNGTSDLLDCRHLRPP